MFSSDFWRAETWHPLSVHFPIALLLVSTLILLISVFLKKNYQKQWQIASSGLLLSGTLAAWISVYTGNLADGVVARKICDPTILKDHEIAAELMTYLFTAAAVLSVLILFNFLKSGIRTISIYVMILLMLTGSGYLIYAGHLGATLVYEQGAGVRGHDVDCSDYE
jgi:uncharacterized membrane protein